MSNLIEFLTSEEIIMVYILAGIACLLAFIIYIIERTVVKRKQRQNTRELNRLVEKVDERIAAENSNMNNAPIKVASVALEEQPQVIKEEVKVELNKPEVLNVEPVKAVEEVVEKLEEKPTENITVEKIEELKIEEKISESPVKPETFKEEIPVVEEIIYTTAEPDKTVAQAELEKLTEELRKAEEAQKNIDLTEFEAEQEENAIISLQELLAKGNEMYEKNEQTQYKDEGNEPISLQDLEAKMNLINEVEIQQIPEASKEVEVLEEDVKVKLDDFNTINVSTNAYKSQNTFKRSPVISPIFGIENTEVKKSDLELENTANYEKLDEEIKKTNEFLMTLKELQKKLD